MGTERIAVCTVQSPAHNLEGHPENAKRFIHFDRITEFSVSDRIMNIQSQTPDIDVIQQIHPKEYLDALQEAVKLGPGFLDYGDTYITNASYESALEAVGGVLQVLDVIFSGHAQSGFALVRPPGHHATRSRAMGFCLLNNIAIAARYAQQLGMERILIVDFDVHHGNGTQDIFEDDPSILFLSTHQSGIFPGSGHIHEIGVDEGQGTVINVPLPPRAGDQALISVYDDILTPLTDRFSPDMILVSAGFDAHWSDPLASLQLTKSGYYHLASTLSSLANSHCQGRIAFILEGGYDPETLLECVGTVLLALADAPLSEQFQDRAPYPETSIDSLLERVALTHQI